MQIVDELHFKKSALVYVERARRYAKEKDYVSAAMEWEKAGEEGYHLAFLMIAIYYISDYFDVEGLPGKAKYKRAIQILSTTTLKI